jgi:hypothetical protein
VSWTKYWNLEVEIHKGNSHSSVEPIKSLISIFLCMLASFCSFDNCLYQDKCPDPGSQDTSLDYINSSTCERLTPFSPVFKFPNEVWLIQLRPFDYLSWFCDDVRTEVQTYCHPTTCIGLFLRRESADWPWALAEVFATEFSNIDTLRGKFICPYKT